MKAPENLVDAVNRLKPRAILLLDTNTIMDPPRLERYEINAPGVFLLVVPRTVDLELESVKRGGKDEQTRQKALRAYSYLGELYDRGKLFTGITLANDRWLITVDAPPPDPNRLEDEQVQRNLGPVDAALLRLAASCERDCPSASTLLITRDNALTRAATTMGLSVCRSSALRSSKALDKMLHDARPNKAQDIDVSALLFAHTDPKKEKPVKIEMRLEELRSEGEYLIARGSGLLVYDSERYPFRWTFPYRNIGMAWQARVAEERDEHTGARFPGNWKPYFGVDEPFWDIVHEAVMPLENVDFMGGDERIPEPVRRFVCHMLEQEVARDQGGLHPPHVRVRLVLNFLIAMGEWGPYDSNVFEELGSQGLKSQEEVDVYNDLCERHNRHIRSLLDGTASSFGDTFRKAFELRKALEDQVNQLDEEAYPFGDDTALGMLDRSLAVLVDDSLRAWSVGETRAGEFTYYPFEWLDEVQESEDGEEDDGEEYEEIFEDDEG